MKNLESFLAQGNRDSVKCAAFFMKLKEKRAEELPVAPASAPAEQQVSHTANLAAALADGATCSLGLSNKYRLYAESINGAVHTHFAEMFVEWSAEVADSASFLLRKANVYGGAVSLGEIESPLAATNIEPILQSLLGCEKEYVDKLKIIHSLMKEDPSVYELEQYMAEAAHRMDDLIQSMSNSIVEKISSVKVASSQEEREKGEERARVNAHAHAEAHRHSRGERVGQIVGNSVGGVGGAVSGYQIAKKLNMGDKEKLVAAIAGGLFGKSILGDVGKDFGKSRDAERLKHAAEGLGMSGDVGSGEGVTSTETAPHETNEEAANQQYLATEGEARRAEAVAQAMYYKQQLDSNKQQLEQANQALQQTQQQAAQLQQQNDQTQQQIQQMMQQNQQMNDMAVQQMNLANQRVMQATEQAMQATNEMQQQAQMAAEIRNSWNQMRAQVMQMAAVEPPMATLQSAQAQQAAQQQQAMAQQAQMGGAPVDPNAQAAAPGQAAPAGGEIPPPAEMGAPPPADTGVPPPEAPEAPEVQPPKTAGLLDFAKGVGSSIANKAKGVASELSGEAEIIRRAQRSEQQFQEATRAAEQRHLAEQIVNAQEGKPVYNLLNYDNDPHTEAVHSLILDKTRAYKPELRLVGVPGFSVKQGSFFLRKVAGSEEHHGEKREAKHPYAAGLAGGAAGLLTGMGAIPGALGGYYGARRAAETGHSELEGAGSGAAGATLGGALGGYGGGALGAAGGTALGILGAAALAKRRPDLAELALVAPHVVGAGGALIGGGIGTYLGGRKGYDIAMDMTGIPSTEKGASAQKVANPQLKHLLQLAKERAPYGLAGAGIGAATMHHDIQNADIEGRRNRISEMEQSGQGSFPQALSIAKEKMMLIKDELGQQHPEAMTAMGGAIGGLAGLTHGPQIAQNLKDINHNMSDLLKG